MVKKGTKVIYTGIDTSVLVTGNEYEVYEVYDDGVRVYIPTGFSGIQSVDYEVIQ